MLLMHWTDKNEEGLSKILQPTEEKPSASANTMLGDVCQYVHRSFGGRDLRLPRSHNWLQRVYPPERERSEERGREEGRMDAPNF